MMVHMMMLSAALVLGGEPKAMVALRSDASESERFAAEELVHWVRELTGATLPIGSADRPDQACVRFERTDSEVRDDGFSVTASDREVILAANKPIGILFGVYHLLGRYGGITWCHPDSGADFVRRSDLTVPNGRLVRNPMAKRMGIPSGNGALATPERRARVALWNVRNGFATGSNRRGADGLKTQPGNYYPNGLLAKLGDSGEVRTGGHVLGELVLEASVDDSELKEALAWTRQHAAEVFTGVPSSDRIRQYARWRVLVRRHPTWFGLVDGERVPTGCALRQGDVLKGKSSMPCLSNAEVREQIYRGFKARQEKIGGGEPVTFSLCCDDQSQWCECDSCLRLLKGKGGGSEPDKASDYWWDFVNDLSARLLSDPLVSLQVYVYRTYQAYPTHVRPVARPRMSIVLCPHGRCYLHALTDGRCKVNEKYRAMFETWAETGLPIDSFEYMNQVPGKCNYAFWEMAWIEDLKWYASKGIRHGAGGLVGPWDGYATDDGYFRRNAAKARWQIGWLTGYFEWAPEADFAAVRDRLFTVYYRSASRPMKAYRALLEQALYATGQCMCYGSGGTLFAAAAFQPGVLSEARRRLEEARVLAKGDGELESRIEADAAWFASNWEAAGISGESAVEMARADEAPTIDGRLDEAFWRRAPLMDDFRKIVSIADTPRRPETRFVPPTTLRLAYDERNLYLACVCTKADGKVVDVPADGSTFAAMAGSHLELYFLSPAQGGKYYHVAVSHNGKRYSALSTSGRERDLSKPLDFRMAIGDKETEWTLEMAVPLAQFGDVKRGDVWKIDVARTAAGPDGKLIRGYGSLCGYGQHMTEYWKTVSFGLPGNLLANGSFEDLVPPPEKRSGDAGLNGRGWTFRSERMPAGWTYQQNGGVGEARTDGAADGQAFLRVGGPSAGRACFLLQDICPYPSEATALRLSFRARGKGRVMVRALQHPQETAHMRIDVNATDWQSYSCAIPLGSLHPTRFMVGIESAALDLDAFVLEPVTETVRFDEGRLLVERCPGKRLVVEDNLKALRAGAVPDYAVGNVIRWLELNGQEMAAERRRFKPVDVPLGKPLLERDGFRLGYMLDISRDKVPTLAMLKTIVDVLAAAGFNALELYTEQTFAYSRHEVVWRNWSPMTAAEIRELDGYAWARGVTLVPNQNSFGHLEKWLQHPEYRSLAAAPNGYALDYPRTRSPYPCALNPVDPRTYGFLDGLYAELLPNFTHSDAINVGCDEVWDIFDTNARCAVRAKEIGVPRLYMEHLLKVHGLLAKRGWRMAFWADVVMRYPTLLEYVPRDAQALLWGYGSEWRHTGYTCEFEGRCLALQRRGISFAVCPSTLTYEGLPYAWQGARGNIDIAVAAGRKYGAVGLLLTEWGDGGHPLPFLASLPAIVYTGLACRGGAVDDGALMAAIDRVAGIPLGKALVQWGTMRQRPEDLPDLERGRAALLSIDLNGAPAWIEQGVRQLRFNQRMLEKSLAKRKPGIEDEAEYRRLWLEANRSGGLDDSVRRYLGRE